MQRTEFFNRYRAHESALLERHRTHPFIVTFCTLGSERIIEFLLQVGKCSEIFVAWYERAKQGYTDERAKELVRQILRDEIPRDAPTHQDDRLADLLLLGVSKERFMMTRASATTRHVIDTMWARVNVFDAHYDLRTLVLLRIAGEILVGQLYVEVMRAWTSVFGLPGSVSRFYRTHAEHDQEDAEGGGHITPFDAFLAEWIVDEQTLAIACRAADDAASMRCSLYDPFIEL